MAQDLNKSGKAIVCDLIKLANPATNYTPEQLEWGPPVANPPDSSSNTDVDVHKPDNPDDVVTLHYNRLDLHLLFNGLRLEIPDNNFDSVEDLLPLINAEYNTLMTIADDIQPGVIAAGPYPKAVNIIAKPNSYAYIGQFSLSITDPNAAEEPDTSFLTEPAATNNQTLPDDFTDGNGMLLAGEGEYSAAGFRTASNSEVQLGGALILAADNSSVAPTNDVYTTHLGYEESWLLPFSMGLVDDRNGEVLTDTYNVVMRIRSENTGQALNLTVQRAAGNYRLSDAIKNVTIEDGFSQTNGSLYQGVISLDDLAEHFGAVDTNGAGAMLGSFVVTLRASRIGGGFPDVISEFTLLVTSDAAPAVIPTITDEPDAATVSEGQTATFTVAASGTAPLSYQWQSRPNSSGSWADLLAATSASYTTPVLALSANGAEYRCVVSNSAGSDTSAAAVLTVNAVVPEVDPPFFTDQPDSLTVVEGATATFSVAYGGTEPVTRQWQRRAPGGSTWSDISGATGSSYTTAALALSENGASYRCELENSAGTVNSNAATVTVNAAVVNVSISDQPDDLTITEGNAASFSLTATGTAPITYAWESRPNSGGAWSALGVTTPTLNLGTATTSMNGRQYRCQVTNPGAVIYSNVVTLTVEEIVVPSELELIADLSYVDTQSAAYTAFINFVNAKRDGGNPYGYVPADAAYAYKLTNDETYRTLAIAGINEMVTEVENAIAANQNATVISGDSYLHVGEKIGGLAIVYEWCNPDAPTKARWAAVANQAVYNVWNPGDARWGSTLHTWSGWSINDPGNNYFYSFCTAAAYWALASDDAADVEWLNDNKFSLLKTYMATLPGGGSREGTGYGVSFMNLFALYQIWRDSGIEDLANANSHLTNSIRYWVHATMPGLAEYCPIGDLARESYPNLFDYHRDLILKARHLTTDLAAKDMASWWLNNISVQVMSQGFKHLVNMLPAGPNTDTPPSELSYYAEGTGSLFTRTGWDADAVFLHFLAGQFDQSHAAQAQGSFTLYHQGFLAVTNNNYSHSGIQQQVRSNNVLRFRTSGGATIPQVYGTATMTRNIGAGGNLSASANLKPVISNSTVTSWQRDIEFTDGVLLVEDTYVTSGGTTAVFQVCTPVQPVVAGNVITAGDLRVEVITPGSPTITIVEASSEDADFNDGWRIDISGGTGSYVVELSSLTYSGSGPGNGEQPTITTQPSDASVADGSTATFTVAATGTAPLAYQWQYRAPEGSTWSDIAGAESATYQRAAVLADDESSYRCVVTNAEGSATSVVVWLTVSAAGSGPTINTHPANATVEEGESIQFEVVAIGTGGLSYQWQVNTGSGWSDVEGAVSSTYSFATTLSMDGDQYRCVVTDSTGSATSNAATATVTEASSGGNALDYAARTTSNTSGLSAVGNLFPGGKTFTVEMLVYFEDGTPLSWNNGDTFMGAFYANRQHTASLNNATPRQMGIRNNETGNPNNFAIEPQKWYLATFSSDSGDALAGQLRLTMQEWQPEDEPALLSSTQSKGEYFSASAVMEALVFGGGSGRTPGWNRAIRVQHIRCYDHVRDDTQLRADRKNTNPAGALWWWEVTDNNGSLAIADITGNNVLPTQTGTITVGEGPALAPLPTNSVDLTFTGADGSQFFSLYPQFVPYTAGQSFEIYGNNVMYASAAAGMQLALLDNVDFGADRKVSIDVGLHADQIGWFMIVIKSDGPGTRSLVWGMSSTNSAAYILDGGVATAIGGTAVAQGVTPGDVLEVEFVSSTNRLMGRRNGTLLFDADISAVAGGIPTGAKAGFGFQDSTNATNTGIMGFAASD